MSVERSASGLNAPFRIGDRLVTPAANEIDGRRVESKAMDVLIALAEVAPAVVLSTTLLERIWRNVVVVDNVVHQAIAQLRKVLRDDARAPRYVETIPRRGYRLIAKVALESIASNGEDGQSDPSKPEARLLAPKPSICVLPFVNMSGDADQEYFSDGISEDIITDLGKSSALSVIARTTAFTFKAKSIDLSQVARHLNVSHILEGSVRRAGGRVRITAQLVDGTTGNHVWTERYDRDLKDIFALQEEIAGAIVNALKLKLLPKEKHQMEQRGTNNLEAYDLYLQGTRAKEELDSIELLEAATRLAPDYSEAWGALASVRAGYRLSRPFNERGAIATIAAHEADRALALDPQNVAAATAQYLMLPTFGRYSEAEALINRTREHSPNDARCHTFRAFHLESVGRMREAIEAAQRAYEMDPLNLFVANFQGQTLYFGGRYAEARQSLERTLARWPDSGATALNLIAVCVHTQDWGAVDSLLAPERLARFPLREHERHALRFASIMRDPSPQTRRRPIDAARRWFEASGCADLTELEFAARLGFLDEAHTIAAQAKFGPNGSPRGDQMGFDAYRTHGLFLSIFPEFRRDRRFIKLCARFGLVDYWIAMQQWPDCVDEVAPYYDFKAECEEVASGPPLPPAY